MKEPNSVFVYLGPTIRGIIQQGTIYNGTLSSILEELKPIWQRYPKIPRLIVEDKHVAEVKNKLRDGTTNIYSIAYKELSD